MRYLVVRGTKVENVIIAEPGFALPGVRLVPSDRGQIGDTVDAQDAITPGVPVPVVSDQYQRGIQKMEEALALLKVSSPTTATATVLP